MANRTSFILSLPLPPIIEEQDREPEVRVIGGNTIEVTVITIKSGGGIQTTKID